MSCPEPTDDGFSEPSAPSSLVSRFTALLRFRPFDTSTPSGRSKERYRRAALSAGASVIARGIGLAVSLVTVPLTLNYLGRERYGMWMTISSVLTMLAFSDLGIGNGLLNALTGASGRDDSREAKEYVSSAFFALASIALVLVAVLAVSYPFIPWARLFNVTSATAASEAGPAAAVFILCFIAALPLGVVQRLRIAYQEGFIDSAWTALGSVATLLLLLLVVRHSFGLPWLVLVIAGAPVLALGINAGSAFLGRWRDLRPAITQVRASAARVVLSAGGYFLILQIAGAVAYQSDSLIVAQMLGADHVTDYSVPMKLFMIVPTLFGYIAAPLWPAYGEAIARGDLDWIRVTFRRSLKLVLLGAAPAIAVVVLLARWVLGWWVGGAVTPSDALIVGGGLWALWGCVGGVLSAFMNGLGLLRFQVVCAVLMMVANVAISVFLTSRIGVAGVVWGSVIAWALFTLLPSVVYIRLRLFGRPGSGA